MVGKEQSAWMGSLLGCFGAFLSFFFLVHLRSFYMSVSDELLCFQGDRGSKGVCGASGPKGEKVCEVRIKKKK